MTDDEFFTATDQLRTIRDWAHARYAAAWAVFGAVLLRVAATTGPDVQLPGVIGGRASLNLLAAFVAPSGGGKGISDKVARLAWPVPIIERPIGSGEGIAATFVPPKKEGVEPVTRAIISVPEVDTLAGIASRQGSILLAQLKSAAMGEQLGQSNSSEATTRIVPAHTYRLCLSVGAQPTHTGVLFDDTTGGTPQRFLWFPTTDPNMPADVRPDPDPLDTRLPMWGPDQHGVVEVVYGPQEIPRTIIDAHIARQRGQDDALDGHAMLTRCKVASTLAILHHRIVVSDLDWELSGAVMKLSNRTREWVVGESKKAARAKVRERAISRAVGEEFIDDRRGEVVRRRVLTVLGSGPCSRSDARRQMGKKEYREIFDSVVPALIADGLIVARSTDRGERLEISDEFTGEPEFTPQNTRSDGENHSSPVNSNESNHAMPDTSSTASPRTLHAVSDTPTAPRPGTAREWVDSRASELLAKGIDTVESTDIYSAGTEAGYQIDALRQAVRKSPLISVSARRGSVTVWTLGTGSGNTIVTCESWLSGWLRDQEHPWVKAADAYAAGLEAGYGRDAVKSAAQTLGVRKRGQSISTEWATALADSGRDVS
ncbi:hypothetical protein [Rhodococcoides corynebacterioides]|uniref:DUF3987 domain-containing protein n=1 Tax=Rhodococcoides corynebacterioides TaxID=53972 RepID=A0ABS7P5F5_9NOCA|nr:hypothetical protein [Rhodococcus corynebacterioides]MBY6367087.1 hypothetical protein [Rhodococcus corynebacterioides]MBY6407348.1 hypothetical protein [Rhodococcus corynebacterioides]